MLKDKSILTILVLLIGIFAVFEILNLHQVSDIVKPLLLIVLAILYRLKVKDKSKHLFLFLGFYSIAELLGLLLYIFPLTETLDNVIYFGGNSVYIIAYLFLIFEIAKSIDFRTVLQKYAIHLLILLALDAYCIFLIYDITLSTGGLITTGDYIIEFIYNTVNMVLLSIALINYISRDSKKAMNILLASLCFVFSEVMQIAYFYITEENVLSVIYSFLLIIAFYFIYIQAHLNYADDELKGININKVEA